MEFILYTAEFFRMLTHFTLSAGAALLVGYVIKTFIGSDKLDKEKKKEIQRLKSINDYYEQFFDKEK